MKGHPIQCQRRRSSAQASRRETYLVLDDLDRDDDGDDDEDREDDEEADPTLGARRAGRLDCLLRLLQSSHERRVVSAPGSHSR